MYYFLQTEIFVRVNFLFSLASFMILLIYILFPHILQIQITWFSSFLNSYIIVIFQLTVFFTEVWGDSKISRKYWEFPHTPCPPPNMNNLPHHQHSVPGWYIFVIIDESTLTHYFHPMSAVYSHLVFYNLWIRQINNDISTIVVS